MHATRTDIPNLWSVILAGGEGSRLSEAVEHWFGQAIPKQYCTFTGTRSMLQHTFDRARHLSHPTRIMTIVTHGHEPYAARQVGFNGDRIIVQPSNRDTAAEVLLPLTYIREIAPDSTAVFYPADHFVYPEDAFIKAVRYAASAIEMVPDRIVLLGIRPNRFEFEYGLLTLSKRMEISGPYHMWQVKNCIERRPGLALHNPIPEAALWNTQVLIGKVDALWKIASTCLPSLMRQFEMFQHSIGSGREDPVIDTLYRVMSTRNFAKDILQQIPDRLIAMELEGVFWNDWGRADRIKESLTQIGKTPAFPINLATVN